MLYSRSRYCRFELIPNAEREPDACLEQLVGIGRESQPPAVLFPTGDRDTLLVAEHAEVLQRWFRFLVPDAETVRTILDKRAQYLAAESAGVPIPRTLYPESVEHLSTMAAELLYPVIVKPYVSGTGPKGYGEKVQYADAPTALIRAFESADKTGARFMVQEVIPGDDDQLFGYLAFWDANGKERAWVCKRKLRQYPPHFGNGSLQVTVDAPEVAELSRKFLHALGYKGFVGVEWKRDARDGTLRLMEINPRVVSGNQIAISAGVDFPWIAYRYLCDGDILDREVPYARGVKYVHEQWDIDAFRALRAAGELRFAGWLGSLRGTKAFAIWAVDDPAPFLAMVWESLRAVIRRISAQMRRS